MKKRMNRAELAILFHLHKANTRLIEAEGRLTGSVNADIVENCKKRYRRALSRWSAIDSVAVSAGLAAGSHGFITEGDAADGAKMFIERWPAH